MDCNRIMVDGIPCDVYRAVGVPCKGTIIYLHGGGLVYGSPRDYPPSSLRRFLSHGYDFISIGYPLAPEASLQLIIDFVADCIKNLFHNRIVVSDSYIAFGRSAGVFLWSAVLSKLESRPELLPYAFLAFYGYASLSYLSPCAHDEGYRSDIRIEEQAALALIEKKYVFDDWNMSRILLYIFARQQGVLSALLGVDEEHLGLFSYERSLRNLRIPSFVAWSANDPEVNPEASRSICSVAERKRIFEVDCPIHDFDQDTERVESRRLIHEALEWLNDGCVGS